MTEINNRIEEVKKKLCDSISSTELCAGAQRRACVDDQKLGQCSWCVEWATQICQLFPQPLPDRVFSIEALLAATEEGKREERKRIIKIVNIPYGQVGNEVSTNSVLLFRKQILNRIGRESK